MRCFIALELDDEIKQRLETAQGWFKEVRGKIGWTNRSQMHLTLKFMGEVAEDRVSAIVDMMRGAARQVPVFEICVEGLGAFPPSGTPRVLWAGIKTCSSLSALQGLIERGCGELGFSPEDREFSPHLTLGRIKERIDGAACRRVLQEHQGFSAGIQSVRRVILFSSRLQPTGAVYTAVAEAELGL